MNLNPSLYHVFGSSFGDIGMLYQKEPFQLKEVFLPGKWPERVDRMEGEAWKKEGEPSLQVEALSRMMAGYFEGEPVAIPWKALDLSRMTILETAVLRATSAIPYGEVASYREIARAIGREKAFRFVGNTLAQNPFPILIPCHRVIRSDQNPGGFGGGEELKKKMIALEKKYKNRYQRNEA